MSQAQKDIFHRAISRLLYIELSPHLPMEPSPAKQVNIPGAEFYDNLGIKYENTFGHDTGMKNAVRKFLHRFPKDALILDCDCGTGKPVSRMIVDSGCRIKGIDSSRSMVDFSRKQVPSGSFEMVNMLEHAPSERFKGIVAMLSLFELSREQITAMTMKWSEWLVESGLLLIGVLGAEDCATKLEMFDDDQKCARNVPNRFMGCMVSSTLFTKAGWDEVLEMAGLRVLDHETVAFSPPVEADCDPEPHYFVLARKPEA